MPRSSILGGYLQPFWGGTRGGMGEAFGIGLGGVGVCVSWIGVLGWVDSVEEVES